MPEYQHLVVDTDTASDDAVALMLAVAATEASLEAVTVVAGNVPVEIGERNALATLELMGHPQVPVHRGLERPLIRRLSTGQHVHGLDGMGDHGLIHPRGRVSDEHAVDALIRLGRERPGELTLVTLGPLTNVAAALLRDRGLLGRYRHTYLMLGAPDGLGNVSPSAEFNAWVDPEAVAIVFDAGADLTLVGWNVSRQSAVMGAAERLRLQEIGTERARFVQAINSGLEAFARDVSGLDGYDLPDPITMAIALDPSIVRRSERLRIGIALGDEVRGQLIIDHRRQGDSATPAQTAEVVWEADEPVFKELLYRMCSE